MQSEFKDPFIWERFQVEPCHDGRDRPSVYTETQLRAQKSFRALRNSDRDLKLPLKKTKNGQKGYSFRGAKSGNGLSAGAKFAPSLASFKSHL